MVHMSRPRGEDNIDHKGVARHSQDRNSADKEKVLELGVLVQCLFVSQGENVYFETHIPVEEDEETS